MRRRAWVLAVLLLALAGAAAWLRGGGRGPGAAPEASGESGGDADAPEGTAAPGLAKREGAGPDAPATHGVPPAARAGARRLRLLARLGSDPPPVPVAFTVGWRRQDVERGRVLERLAVTATGPAEAWVDLGAATGVAQAYARSEDGAWASRPDAEVLVTAASGELVEQALEVFPSGSIVGRVVAEEDRRPIPGARVVLDSGWGPFEPPPTDADGRFRIDAVAGSIAFHVEARGFAPTPQVRMRVLPGREHSVSLTLPRGWTLLGRALGEDGRFLQGSLRAGLRTSTLDEGGRFRFENLRPGDSRIGLEWSDGGRASARGNVLVASYRTGEVDVGDVTLGSWWHVTLELRTTDGTPVRGVQVGGLDPAEEGFAWGGFTNAEGRVSTEVRGGEWRIRARGLALWNPPTVRVGPDGPREPVALVVHDALRIRGRVTYASAERPEFKLFAVSVREPDGKWYQNAATDLDGRFELWVPRSWVGAPIVVTAGDSSLGDHGRVRAAEEEVELGVGPQEVVGFRVRVVDADGTTPVPFYDLDVTGPRQGRRHAYGVGQSGDATAVVWPLAPGEWTVTVRPWDGRPPASATVRVDGPEWPTVTVRLAK